MKNHCGHLKFSLSTMIIGICAVSPLCAHASSDKEKALLAASASAPLVFTIPYSQAPEIMGKARSLIGHWDRVDSGPFAADILKASDTHIWTHTPAFPNEVGFNVTCTVTDSGDQISVVAWSLDNQLKESRGHLLAYLLEQYAATLPAGSLPNVSSPGVRREPDESRPAVSADIEENLDLIRSQIASGHYDAALSSIDYLKSKVMDAKKGHTGAAPIADTSVPTANF